MTIGDRIRVRRKALGFTQTQLAERVRERMAASDAAAKVHQSDVSCWERGTTPSTPVLIPLADVLDAPLRWLLSGEGPAPAEPNPEALDAVGS